MFVIRTKTVTKTGHNPFSVFFPKPHLLLVVRVATRINESSLYTEKNMTDYELGTAGYTNFMYDVGQFTSVGHRSFTETSLVSLGLADHLPIKYVITYLEFID